jgi:hypothetical protein
MIIKTSRADGPISPSRVRSVEALGFIAAGGSPTGVGLQKWIDGNGNDHLPGSRTKADMPVPAIVFRPHESGVKEVGTTCPAAIRPRLPGKRLVAGVARLLPAGSPRATGALVKGKSRYGRRTRDANRRRHALVIVLRLI